RDVVMWYYCTALVCFFFSSRRRHTRSKRDWSSDVCSSDLKVQLIKPKSYKKNMVILCHNSLIMKRTQKFTHRRQVKKLWNRCRMEWMHSLLVSERVVRLLVQGE